jgi:7-keto-8-aminopelargonate synthetase-like enzyme
VRGVWRANGAAAPAAADASAKSLVMLEPEGCEGRRAEGLRRVAALRDALLDDHNIFAGVERPTRLDLPGAGGAALRLVATAAHSDEDIDEVAAALRAVASKVLPHR